MSKKGKFTKNCPICNGEQVYGRYDHYLSAIRGNWNCRKCGKFANTGKRRHGDILHSWFAIKQRSAADRGLEWDIDIEWLWDLYLAQNKLCSLSGVEIGWAKKGFKATASIDRIDSTKGYTKDNSQLVHKDVNFMKQSFVQGYFVEMCINITNFTKKQKPEN